MILIPNGVQVKPVRSLACNRLTPNPMADPGDTVAGRMKEARLQAAVRLRETVSQERMAELVGKELGKPMHQTQWRRYETDREPPLEVIVAAAKVSGLSEAYIAFGTPDADRLIDPARDRRLSYAEEQRALRVAEESSASAKKLGTKAKKRGSGGR
jgi:transcriptional regulator with XRE-family HTH domain